MGIIDAIVAEPEDGAHRNPNEAARQLQRLLLQELAELQAQPLKRLLRERSRKFRRMGEYTSHFRVAMSREVELLQGLVVQGMRQGVRGVKRVGRLRPRRKRGTTAPPVQPGKELPPSQQEAQQVPSRATQPREEPEGESPF